MGLFGDWQRMYRANQQHLEQQGKPSSFFGQIADIPNQMKEAADNTDLGLRMSRHLQLTNGEGLPAVAIVDGSWQVGTYANTSPVVRIPARVERADGTEPYIVTCDHVVAAMHMTRMQPGAKLGVMVDPLNPTDFAIDWIRTGQLGPLPRARCPDRAHPAPARSDARFFGQVSRPIHERPSALRTSGSVFGRLQRRGHPSVRLPDLLGEPLELGQVLLAVGHLLLPARDVDGEDRLQVLGRDVDALEVELVLGRDDAHRSLAALHLAVLSSQQPQQRAQVVAVARPQEVPVLGVALEPVDVREIGCSLAAPTTFR